MPSQPRTRLRVLLLADDARGTADTVADHIGAFTRDSRHRVVRVNPRPHRHFLAPRLDDFDAVILHYSVYALSDSYLPADFRDAITRFAGLKVQFVQDDYRQVAAFADRFASLGIDLLYTLYPEADIARVWRRFPQLEGVEIRSTLAGYVPERLVGRPTPPLAERPLDVAYRGREVPFWLGAFGQEKAEIGRRFLEAAPRHGLRCDIGWRETDRIYGEDWLRLLASARAVLGTESGASITDFDGQAQARVERFLETRPGAAFAEVAEAVLGPFEGNQSIRVISPRVFEATALRTALVLYPGTYSGILEPWTHYLPLEKDFGNLDEVVGRLRDVPFLEAMVARAHRDLVESGRYGYRSFMAGLDADLGRAWDRLPAARRDAARRRRRRGYPLVYARAAIDGLAEAGWPHRHVLLRTGAPQGRSLAARVPSLRRLAPRRARASIELGLLYARLAWACLRTRRGRALVGELGGCPDLPPARSLRFALRAAGAIEQARRGAGRLAVAESDDEPDTLLVTLAPEPRAERGSPAPLAALREGRFREIRWSREALAGADSWPPMLRVIVPESRRARLGRIVVDALGSHRLGPAEPRPVERGVA